MIVGISDGVGMTQIINSKSDKEEAKKHYLQFYQRHLDILEGKDWEECKWRVVKTTGDGLFFYTPLESKYIKCLRSMMKLYNNIQTPNPTRLFIYHCENKKIIYGKQISKKTSLRKHIIDDLFGDQLNLGFRLLNVASKPLFFTEQNFINKTFKNDKKNKEKINKFQYFEWENYAFMPIPVTKLKGITNVGFSIEEGIKPHWIWDIYEIN